MQKETEDLKSSKKKAEEDLKAEKMWSKEKESEVDIHQISQDLRDLKDAQSVDRLSSFRAH